MHERVLTLDGGRNFRDMGGYPTECGRPIKWRKLFRSGSMNGFTAAGYEQLMAVGLQVVCDFRSTSERERHPTDLEKLGALTYWARDYSQSLGNLEALLNSDRATPQEARETMLDIYRGLPAEQAPAYRPLFRLLAEGELPLGFQLFRRQGPDGFGRCTRAHCSWHSRRGCGRGLTQPSRQFAK